MVPIPVYLEKYAAEKRQKNNKISFRLKCTCGCETFFIPKKIYTKEEKEFIKEYEGKIPNIGWHTLCGETDVNGNECWYIKKFFIFKKYLEFPKPPIFLDIKVIKVICSQCQKEIVVFDNRCHGYDGMTTDNIKKTKYIPHFEECNNMIYNIYVTIKNDTSLEEFNDNLGDECSYEFYSNAFSRIIIFGVDENGKKKILCDEETA